MKNLKIKFCQFENLVFTSMECVFAVGYDDKVEVFIILCCCVMAAKAKGIERNGERGQ